LGKLIFITGGARSGKSTYAEKLAADGGGKVLYIATAVPFDEEMKLRIKKHRQRRPKEWQTVEAYKDLDNAVIENSSDKKIVLLDCITVMITNLMIDKKTDWGNISESELEEIENIINDEVDKLINTVHVENMLFLVVSNELGMGLVPEYPMGRVFRDIAGRVNQKLAKAADEVFVCISSIPVKIK